LISTSLPAQPTACSIFTVQKASARTPLGCSFSIGNNNGIAAAVDGTGNVERDVLAGGVAWIQDSTLSDTTSWEKWTITGSAAPLQTLRVNGAARTISPSNSSTIAATTGSTIFSQTAAGSSFWNGSVAEIIVFDRVLSAAEIARVEGYLSWKYGL